MHGWGWRGLGLVVLLGLTPSVAAAQPTGDVPAAGETRADREARSLFQAGRLAMEDGRFEEALGYFERSYELSERPLLLYNIGVVAERLRRDRRALEAFQQYLEQVPDAANRREVARRIDILEQQLAEPQSPPQQPRKSGPDVFGPASPPPVAEKREQPEPLWTRWWLWAAVGVVVAGGVTAGFLLVGGDDDVQEPLPGRDGVVVFTLERP